MEVQGSKILKLGKNSLGHSWLNLHLMLFNASICFDEMMPNRGFSCFSQKSEVLPEFLVHFSILFAFTSFQAF